MYIVYDIETHGVLGQYDHLSEALEVIDMLSLMGIEAEAEEVKE